jgi:hypothetical protein
MQGFELANAAPVSDKAVVSSSQDGCIYWTTRNDREMLTFPRIKQMSCSPTASTEVKTSHVPSRFVRANHYERYLRDFSGYIPGGGSQDTLTVDLGVQAITAIETSQMRSVHPASVN